VKILNVVGARPNFMKISPLIRKMRECPRIEPVLVHTGQHYDKGMSEVFFHDLDLPKPNAYLGIGSGSHAAQTGKTIIEFEKVCIGEKPDSVVVVGDVNSTMACSIAAAKLGIPLAHVEAGLRNFDRAMPEEINRMVTDSLSDFLFTTCEDAGQNLRREGISEERIFLVGNVMIDTLLQHREKSRKSGILEKLGIKTERSADGCKLKTRYCVLTLHRPSNVDHEQVLKNIIEALQEVSKNIPVIFPVHPRTRKQIELFGYEKYFNFIDIDSQGPAKLRNAINLLDHLSYLEFLDLMSNARFVLTDSGGIQEETTILDIPCLTLLKNTERPITVKEGTNTIVGTDAAKIVAESSKILNGSRKSRKAPEYWDGKAADRIVDVLLERL
jgi:UDP-N-acetylglucosamine 2-epimerase (non-hydrolysing)